MILRKFQEADREAIKTITAICFEGVSVDHNIEQRWGLVGDKDWRFRKLRHIDADISAGAAGIRVAEENGQVIGYITTRIDAESRIAWIPNLGVLPEYRGRGIGRQLIQAATDYATAEGMMFIRIETLEQNPVGQMLYPSCGFEEVARQIYYVKPLAQAARPPEV